MALLLAQADFSVHVRQELLVRLSVRVPAVEFVRIVPVSVEVRVRADDETVHESAESVKDVAHVRVSFVGKEGGETRASRDTGRENALPLYRGFRATRLDRSAHGARIPFGSLVLRSRVPIDARPIVRVLVEKQGRQRDGRRDGFGTEGDEDGGEDGRGRPGSRCPWKGGRRAVAAECQSPTLARRREVRVREPERADAPPPVTPQVMRWAEDVRRERRESRVVGKLRLPPPVTTGVLKWAVEANERGEGMVPRPGLFGTYIIIGSCAVRYGTSMRGHDGRGFRCQIRRRAGSAPSTPLGARGRLRTVPEASNEEEGGRSRTGRRRGACRTRRGPLGGPVLAPCEVGRVPSRGGLGDPGARVQRSGARRAARPRPGGDVLTRSDYVHGILARIDCR
eukprot:jgi/Mesvir1/8057/Mv07799-RA.1